MNKQLFFPAFVLALIGLVFFCGCGGSGSGGNKATGTTDNGFQYIHHIQNEGAKPQPGEYAYFHFEVYVDDSLLQSSHENPKTPLAQLPTAELAKMQPNPVIDVLPMMAIGDSMTVSQSLDSLPKRPPGFEKFNEFIFTVSLQDIKNEEEYKVIADAEEKERKEKAAVVQARIGEITEFSTSVLADYKAGKLEDQIVVTDSGLKYVIHEEGKGAVPDAGEVIDVHYYGMLTDGTMFDSSFKGGMPISFPVGRGQVIPGWDEGLTIFKRGTKGTLFIPYELAYGEAGSPPVIPPKSELVFYVELLDNEVQ